MSSPQSDFDKMSREQMEELSTKRNVPDIQNKAQIALRKLDQMESEASTDRRHRESLAVDRSARRIAVVALIVAGIALVNDFGVFGGKGLPVTPEPQRLPSSSTSAHPAEPKPAYPLSTATASALPSPMPSTPAKSLPLPEPTPDTPPAPKE